MEEQLKRIQDKIQHLLKQQAALQKENRDLKATLDQLRTQSENERELIHELKQKVEILKISSGTWDEADKKQFEKRINTYIKEIDRCITLLSE